MRAKADEYSSGLGETLDELMDLLQKKDEGSFKAKLRVTGKKVFEIAESAGTKLLTEYMKQNMLLK